MEFHVFGAGRVERRREFVDLAGEPIRLRFVDADSTENKVFLADVPRRAGIIEVQKVDKKSSRVDSRPTDRNAALSTAIRVYHRFPERDQCLPRGTEAKGTRSRDPGIQPPIREPARSLSRGGYSDP
jgi:hypothetical protein